MNATTAGHRTRLNGILFSLTVLTTWFAGMFFAGYCLPPEVESLGALFAPRPIGLGLLYAMAVMSILVGHELGHYLACRRYGVLATLPFFIPGPPFLGTFGAFIRIKSPVRFKHQIFDVGANGPLTGFALALPILVIGLALSKVGPLPTTPGAITFGDTFGQPLAFKLLSGLFFGRIPEGSSLALHPIGFAGWVGLLVTSFNLIPLGQLDGGHVAYALLGMRARFISWVMVAFLAVMGVFFHLSWLLLAAVMLFFEFKSKMRLRHPPVLDEGAPLGPKRTFLSFVVLLVFVLSFIPDPIKGASLLDILGGRWGAGG